MDFVDGKIDRFIDWRVHMLYIFEQRSTNMCVYIWTSTRRHTHMHTHADANVKTFAYVTTHTLIHIYFYISKYT